MKNVTQAGNRFPFPLRLILRLLVLLLLAASFLLYIWFLSPFVSRGFSLITGNYAYAAENTVEKYWSEMTEAEKTAALSLLKSGANGFTLPLSVTSEGTSHALNESLWFSRGILVYGESFGGTSDAGPRYWGYDMNGGYYANFDFPRDKDSGKAAYLKNWFTLDQIEENTLARSYVGDLALDGSLFSTEEKRETAELWLLNNPEWVSAGLDVSYILQHFCFNSVISDSGITQGQFIGVHRATQDGNLYYQVFVVEVPARVFLTTEEEPEETETPEEETGEPEESVKTESVTVNANALITGPDTVYVGETFELTDRSSFTIGGTSYQTQSAYKTFGLSSDWSSSGDIWAEDEVTVSGSFDTSGRKKVTLTIGSSATYEKSDGTVVNATVTGTRTASKTLTVLPVPSAEVTLSGPSKANRAEYMILNIHKYPTRSLSRIEIRITDESGSVEYLRLIRNLGTGSETASGYKRTEALSDSVRVTDGRILSRSLEKGAGSSDTLEVWTLPFLSKNGTETTYHYSVTVTDTGGYSGTTTGSFTQQPDKAPACSLSMAESFYREESGNIAVIEVSDSSPADGDSVRRTWYLAPFSTDESGTLTNEEVAAALSPDAYTQLSASCGNLLDRSFGTGEAVSFEKTGVGLFSVKLVATDVWTEETFPEFVTKADVLQGECFRIGEVLNLPPRVSATLATALPTANFLILTDTEAEAETLRDSFSMLEAGLKAKGISASLDAVAISPSPSSEASVAALSYPVSLVKTISESPYGYEGAYTFLNSCAAVDNYRLYTVTGTFASTGADGYPSSPYTIRAYTASTGALAWTYTLRDSVMSVSTSGSWHSPNTRLVTDLAGRYVFFRSGTGKTLVLNARTGAYLTVLNMNIGGGVYSYGDFIYFYRQDGLWKVNAGTGAATKLYSGTFLLKAGQGDSGGSDTGNGSTLGIGTAANLYQGNFIAVELRSGSLYRTSFNPKTEVLTKTQLSSASGSWTVLNIDSSGKLILHSASSSRILTFNAAGSRLSSVGVASSPSVCSYSVNEYGVTNYVSDGSTVYYDDYMGKGSRGIYKRYTYNVNNGTKATFSITSSSQFYPYSSIALFSVERSSVVRSPMGRYWTYVLNYGYNGYDERCITLVSDMNAKSVSTENISSLGLDAIVEFGGRSDSYLFSRADQNATSGGFVVTRILKEPRTREQLETLFQNRRLLTDADLNLTVSASEATVESLYQLALQHGLVQEDDSDEPSAYYSVKTGETVEYTISYLDPEGDPSKSSFWKVTYTPTGETGSSSVSTGSTPPTVFSKAGRYLIEHRETDSTGNAAYDLSSNSIYLLVYVSDGGEPVIPKNLAGGVYHTTEWEKNRLAWNSKNPDKIRAENVFWAGEQLICQAEVEGDAVSVTATLKRSNGDSVSPLSSSSKALTYSGETSSSGLPLYTGTLWDSSWINAFGRTSPESFVVTFLTTYSDGSTLSVDVPVVFDTLLSFYQIHRLF